MSKLDEQYGVAKEHQLPFKFSMMLPAFKGGDAVAAVEALCNPRGFVLIDKFQRGKKYCNIFSAGVCVAIPPVEATPEPVGATKTGYMIKTIVTAFVHYIAAELQQQPATARASWNAMCLADRGDTGTAFVARPQIPLRNVNWFKKGKWVHLTKVVFEKYFLYNMKHCHARTHLRKIPLQNVGFRKGRTPNAPESAVIILRNFMD